MDETEFEIAFAGGPDAKTAIASLKPLGPLTDQQFDFVYDALMNERADRAARINEGLRELGEEPSFLAETTAVVVKADPTTFERLVNYTHALREERKALTRKLGQVLLAASQSEGVHPGRQKPTSPVASASGVYFIDGFCSCRKCGLEWRAHSLQQCPRCAARQALDDLRGAEDERNEARKIAAMLYRELADELGARPEDENLRRLIVDKIKALK